MTFLFYLAALTLVMVIASMVTLEVGKRSIKFLKETPAKTKDIDAKVSVIIPARNEEDKIEEALTSVLSQDYPDFEVIVVNDRSTDGTRQILERLERARPKEYLQVLHVEQLPQGWLGKNHALYYGAEQATGSVLLFADADVVMTRTALSKAMTYLRENQLDHIVVGPHVLIKSTFLSMMILTFLTSFMLFFRPWKAKDRKSKRSTGGGAFSLFRKEVYDGVGTMRGLATAVDDDLKIGQRIKAHGFRQEFLAGEDTIFIEWYHSAREMIEGLTKNSFSVLDYSLVKVVAVSAISVSYYVWPVAAVLLTSGWTQLLNALVVLLTLLMYLRSSLYARLPPWHAIGYPVAMSVQVYIMCRSAWITLSAGGITWRGTFYSLNDLKRAGPA